jgi:DNA-binding response OmpR family regulator
MKPDILIIDDSPTVQVHLQGALTTAGYAVTATDTLSAARMEMQSRRFALLILDVLLPDGDGVDLLRELKADAGRAALPVIMLSTQAEVQSRLRGLSTGADEYVGKPYDASYLLRCVRRLLGAGALPSAAPPDRGLGERKVVVIGNRSTYLTVLAERLRLDRHDVVHAHSLEEAYLLLRATSVDCIVVDSADPGLDGLDACRRIRRTAELSAIPLMLLVPTADLRALEQSPPPEVDVIAERSTNLTTVRARLRDLLRQAGSRRS